MIKNKEHLRIAYEMVTLIQNAMRAGTCDFEIANGLLTERKREIREYYKRQNENKMHIVKDYGIDGYIELLQFPDCVQDMQKAQEYFEENYKLVCSPSMYDCTGQAFTEWEKIFERNGKMMCYHRVGFDL